MIHCYKGYDSNNEINIFPEQDNSQLAFLNTPRLNSLFRNLIELSKSYNGKYYLYDFMSLVHGKADHEVASKRKGITIDGKIIYQEDIDEGRITIPDFSDLKL